MNKVLDLVLQPHRVVRKVMKTTGMGSLSTKLRYDLYDRPHYAYCMAAAARTAKALGVQEISILEFGVAGGRGLLEIEAICPEVEKEFGVSLQVWGFDTGEGLPEPVDYRDLPYIWQAGFYKMETEKLKQKLKRSNLVLGDVKYSVPKFYETYNPAPVGVAFFDLDFWSSTLDAMEIFSGPEETRLPRVFCYCDDVISADGGGILSEDVGQLRAIADYNAKPLNCKLRPIAGFPQTRVVRATWPSQIYVHHDFDHSGYNTYIHDVKNRQLAIS